MIETKKIIFDGQVVTIRKAKVGGRSAIEDLRSDHTSKTPKKAPRCKASNCTRHTRAFNGLCWLHQPFYKEDGK